MSGRYSFSFLLLAYLALSWACQRQTEPAETAETPNILLILADDVGREVLGSYGGTSYETPHLDSLATTGMRFDHTYSMPVCHPSRISLLTGRYPFQVGNPEWGTFPRTLENTDSSSLPERCRLCHRDLGEMAADPAQGRYGSSPSTRL